jgi:hypothetical protein
MLLDLVRAYQTNGNEALGHYDDGDETPPVADAFRALLAGSDLLPAPVPALIAYLEDYPRGRPTGAEDFFYWSVVDFGLKPTMRVSHVTIDPLADTPSSDIAYAIAIKQLYASQSRLDHALAQRWNDRLRRIAAAADHQPALAQRRSPLPRACQTTGRTSGSNRTTQGRAFCVAA